MKHYEYRPFDENAPKNIHWSWLDWPENTDHKTLTYNSGTPKLFGICDDCGKEQYLTYACSNRDIDERICGLCFHQRNCYFKNWWNDDVRPCSEDWGRRRTRFKKIDRLLAGLDRSAVKV